MNAGAIPTGKLLGAAKSVARLVAGNPVIRADKQTAKRDNF
jgi:hypothetical protein